MPRRRAYLVGAAIALLLTAPGLLAQARGAVPTRGGWDASQQRAVARAGILRAGRGARPLSAASARAALRALARRAGTRPVAVHRAPTVTSFDAALVRALGLGDVAGAVRREAARAGLRPPARFGTEVVARALGLRHDFPAGSDALELYPSDRITRAEAAWSLAVVLRDSGWAASSVRATFAGFRLPRYSAGQRRALRIAVSRIGYPYVWGGETDKASTVVYGPQAHGGYDCSGFVWRVFKLSGLAAGRRIGGRTADAMAREFPRAQRVSYGRVRAGDVLFFGTPRYVGHTAIALGGGFLIESSAQGVAVAPLGADWRRHEFRWARRIL